MSLKSLIVGILAGLLIGGMPASADETTTPEVVQLTEAPRTVDPAVSALQVQLKEAWSEAKALGAEVNDLRVIRDRAERKIARKDARLERREAKIAELRERLRNR